MGVESAARSRSRPPRDPVSERAVEEVRRRWARIERRAQRAGYTGRAAQEPAPPAVS